MSFTRFLTTRIIQFLYGLTAILALILGLYGVWRSFEASVGFGLTSLIVGAPIFVFVVVVVARLWLELLVVIFRIAENTSRIPLLGSAGAPTGDQPASVTPRPLGARPARP